MFAWHILSAFGGLTPATALAVLAAVLLAARGHLRLALEWCLLFGLAMLAVAASKIAFYGWGIGSRELGFAGFSGHAARAAAVYPVLAAVVLGQAGNAARLRLAVIAAMVLAALVAASRVALGAHWVAESALGFSLGTLAACGFIRRARGVAALPMPVLPLALFGGVLLLTPAREPINAERWMVVLGVQLSGHDRPYMRWSFRPAIKPWKRPCTLADVLADRACS